MAKGEEASSSSGGNETSIDVDLLSQNISMSDKCCIFKVPYILRRHNEQAYIPNAFSIGPWHHNKEELKATKTIKLKYLNGILSRHPGGKSLLKEITKAIREIEEDVRACYAEPVYQTSDELVNILILDGCFLIELFRKDYDASLRDSDDPIFNMCYMLQNLYHDLILLENQIPWLVLEILFELTKQTESRSLSFLVLSFFRNIFSFTPPPILQPLQEQKHQPFQGQKHILDLLRNWLISSCREPGYHKLGWQPIPSATYLVQAGIKLKRGKAKSILDITFKDGVLEIPELLIQETTEVIFRNLISYEQCCPNCPARITSYAMLLDNLINTNEDMDALTKVGIIDNFFIREVGAQFFNKLFRDAYIKEYCYLDLSEKVNKYCLRRWPTWRAMFVRHYFGYSAAFFNILTILQTVFTIINK